MRRRGLERPPGLEPAHHAQPPGPVADQPGVFAAEQLLGAEGQGQVERTADLDAVKARGGNADDRRAAAVDPDGAADGRRIAAVFVRPEPVAEHHARRGAPLLVVGIGEETAEGGANAEQIEEAAAHPQAVLGETRFAARREIERRAIPREQVREGLLALAQLLPLRIRQIRVGPAELPRRADAPGHAHDRELPRMAHGQRAQPQGLDQLEDGGVGAGAEREREQRDGGEARRSTQHAPRVAQVAPGVGDERDAPGIARLIHPLREAPETAERRRARLVGAHPRGQVFVDQPVDVERILLLHLLFNGAAAEQRAQAKPKREQPAHLMPLSSS